ncbi:LacI family DNA-binding transcriptional regulator [Thermoactinomyces sp. CICC 10522]|uniref:LacI family DNA-binding transcriptional regulator n=1 Tax=Thermoactinomyces sp. CICC 10522 TaxID=2767427 RepID=UPI0018DB5A88|nr:LacI family DNA-binding transcriptional regulator [Thermoactinomyces sp. CICC 10522]MBH8605474.1 LacI family DNA-binding transcriptional regulator [Thermoactinomyces sp. CICC 10522]
MAENREGLTINEIARLAGVSRSTVSRVISGHTNVKPETRKLVEEVIRKSNYRPNPIAQGLVKGSLKMIGLLIGDIRNPFYAEIARGVEDVAHKSGYMVVFFNSDYDIDRELFYLQAAQQFSFSGLVLMSVLDTQELVPVLKNIKCPIVMLNRYIRSLETDVVLVDNFQGGYLAAKHLIELGHTRIAHLAGPSLSTASRERIAGFKQALREYGIKINERDIVQGDLRLESGCQFARRWLSQSNRPTGIFVANDIMALGVMDEFQKQGVNIPNDVSIVGYDDLPYAGVKQIGLTTIRQPHYQMGAMAMSFLIERIRNTETFTQRMTFMPELVVRSTTAPVSKEVPS